MSISLFSEESRDPFQESNLVSNYFNRDSSIEYVPLPHKKKVVNFCTEIHKQSKKRKRSPKKLREECPFQSIEKKEWSKMKKKFESIYNIPLREYIECNGVDLITIKRMIQKESKNLLPEITMMKIIKEILNGEKRMTHDAFDILKDVSEQVIQEYLCELGSLSQRLNVTTSNPELSKIARERVFKKKTNQSKYYTHIL